MGDDADLKCDKRQELEAALAEWAEFEDRSAWHQSKRGNPWRRWGDSIITIFRRRGKYAWCISGDDEEPEYSHEEYETLCDAISGVGHAIGVGMLL